MATTDSDLLAEQILSTWRRHHDILLYLLRKIPARGWTALPSGSKGRDVARQFAHLDRNRRSWLHYHRTGQRRSLPRVDKGPPPTRAAVRQALQQSGRDVERYLSKVVHEGVRPRLFGRSGIRWMGYLIAHESHHRGQIMLALKQSGHRLPDSVAVDGLWGQWIFGK